MTPIQQHFDLYTSGLWQCPTTGMLLTLEERPYTYEEMDAMEHGCLDEYNEWCEQFNVEFAA